MNTSTSSALVAALALAATLLNGCSTRSMKGTPFYTGEYAQNRGPAARRVNGWPLLYYRDPALSVLWPVFELTDEHVAVRPLFSSYAQGQGTREYNVLWPLAQVDQRSGDRRVFPLFWGKDYEVLFPVWWQFDEPFGTNGGSHALFPLWIATRRPTNESSLWLAPPLTRFWRDPVAGESGSMILPLYWQARDRDSSLFVSLPWMSGTNRHDRWRALMPLFYQASNDTRSLLVTPLWATGHGPAGPWHTVVPLGYWNREQGTLLSPFWAHWRAERAEWDAAPWLFSWRRQTESQSDLWLLAGMARAHWGESPGPHHWLPFYYRNATNETLLTPLTGWNGRQDYFYPLTPLAGVRTGQHGGGWLFPFFSHSRNQTNGHVRSQFLLAGGHSRRELNTDIWFYPLFSYHNRGPLESRPQIGESFARYGTRFWSLPGIWHENQSLVRRPRPKTDAAANDENTSHEVENLIRTYSRKHGAFPLWSFSRQSDPTAGTCMLNSSALLWLYDYRHETNTATARDYTRQRVLWRLWHHERLNDNVSLDVFPAFTYDRDEHGARKTSFLWRFLRHERSAEGKTKLDVLFIPLRR